MNEEARFLPARVGCPGLAGFGFFPCLESGQAGAAQEVVEGRFGAGFGRQ